MKKIALSVTLLAVLLAAAYLVAGYYFYDKLSTVTQNPKNAANTPSHFTVTEPDFANFDATPYQMPSYETVRFTSRPMATIGSSSAQALASASEAAL